jgi:hypothetical protein
MAALLKWGGIYFSPSTKHIPTNTHTHTHIHTHVPSVFGLLQQLFIKNFKEMNLLILMPRIGKITDKT